MQKSIECDKFRWEVSSPTHFSQTDTPIRPNRYFSYTTVADAHSEPRLWRQLERSREKGEVPNSCSPSLFPSPAHKISDDVGVTYDKLITVLCLIWGGSMKELSESRFNTGPILKELLHSE